MKKTLCRLFTLSAALLVLTSCARGAEQPNIVVILCDDLGYGDLSAFGHPLIKTPHLDKMAEEGIKLTCFYSAAPVCSPSRAGLLTGRSPNRAGIYDFIPGPKKSKNCRDLVHLQSGEKTIPAMLKTVGYATCLSGKWHCSSYFNSDKQPKPDHFGFDHWFATHNNAAPSHENPDNFVRNGEKVGKMQGFSCQLVIDETLNWLKQKEQNRPFYLQVCFHEPHEPVASPRSMVKHYLPVSDNENQAQYFANVENMDAAVGRLLEYLKQNHNENTLIVFSSDNGPETLNRYSRAYRSYGSPGKLKGMKLWTAEAGFRVPGIMCWLGKETFKGTSDAVVSSLDFMPTFAQLANAQLPEKELDGQSLLPLLETGRMKRIKPLTWAFYNALNQHRVAMRTDHWKIMCRLKTDTAYLSPVTNLFQGNEHLVKTAELVDFELYDMTEDIGEAEDVAGKYPEILTKKKQQLHSEYAALLEGSHIWSRGEE